MLKNKIIKIITAEIFGTFGLVFIGCGSIISNTVYNNTIGHLGISAGFGTIVMIMIYSVGNISGAHLNPAVTLGFFCAKRLDYKLILPYIISQLIGAFLAVYTLHLIFPTAIDFGTTLPSSTWQVTFVAEVVFTFLLMFVILNVSTGHMEKGIMAGVAVGATVGVLALIGGPISGASMNPARSIAPAFMSSKLQHLWVYIAAPILGAIIAVPVAYVIQGNGKE